MRPVRQSSRNQPASPADRCRRIAGRACGKLRLLRPAAPPAPHRIALVVGVILTAINQSGVIASGHATTATWVRCGLNFVVPFLVSDAGLLSARR